MKRCFKNGFGQLFLRSAVTGLCRRRESSESHFTEALLNELIRSFVPPLCFWHFHLYQIPFSLTASLFVLLVSSAKVICYQSKSHKCNRTLRWWSTKSPERKTPLKYWVHLSVWLEIHHFKSVVLWTSSEMILQLKQLVCEALSTQTERVNLHEGLLVLSALA